MSVSLPRLPSIPRGLMLPGFVALVVIPTLLVGAMFEIHRELARSRELRAAVNHSYEERLQLQTVFSLMQDAETGQRGYVITGQERFLEPYHQALGLLGEERTRLRMLQESETEDPARLQKDELKNLVQLEALIDAKLANMSKTIAARRQGAALGQAVVATGEGKRIMDAIRVETARMAADEAAALQSRVQEDAARTHSTGTAVLVTFGVMGAALLATFVLVLRQLQLRQGLMKKFEASAARNLAIFESASDGLITFNRSGTIESINKAAELMSGFTREELARRDVGVLLALPDNEKVFVERLDEAGAGAGPTRQYEARRKDGTHFPVEVSLGRFEHGGEALLVASVRDITERRRVEKLKSEFVSTVSHELRTPLTSISGSLGLLVGGAAGDLPDKAARLLGIAHSNCQRLVRLINDILDIEKMESGQLSLVMTPLTLEEVARKSVDAMGGLAAELGVRLELRVAENLPPIRGDADRLAQVAANLLSNAAKFSPAGETVQVDITRAEGGRVRLSVRDRGPGVPEAFRDRIFSKFAQADGSDSRAKGGTGLGLAISKEIVERHGGRLWFESEAGQGAVFHADFPPLARAEVGSLRGPRVLVCEDDPDAAAVLGEVLRREGFAPVVAGSLAEAQAALEHPGGFAAVLLDLHLPDGHGLDLLRRLREHASTQAIPVLIVSGEADACRFHPFDLVEWLQKPVDTLRLRAAIRRAAPQHGAERPLVLHVEDDADVREIVADVLGPICDIVAAESLDAAQQLLRTIRPQLAILDLALADGSGLQLIPRLNPPGEDSIPIIVFSAQSMDDEALAASVDAVLTKSCSGLDELGAAVHRLVAAREGQG